MAERIVTMKGNPLHLLGKELKAGVRAPAFTLTGNDMAPVKLESFSGKIVVISCVPSLDTPVCDIQTRKFNDEAAKLSKDVVILTVSRDLPFAQKRWCGAAGADRVITLSDYRDGSFAQSYGILIDELKLNARAVFVIDKKGIIAYTEIVKEIASEPDYKSALKAVSECAK